jgi:rubrerythrin
MKNLNRILILTTFFSLALVFRICAEEVKMPENATAVVSETVSTAQAVPVPVEKTTLDNLQEAFNGESNLHARYLAFAQKADAEGCGKVASLFRAAARAEQVHFERIAKVIKGMGGTPAADIETPVVKSTAENVEDTMKGEVREGTVIYPEFLAKAKKDNNKEAIDIFKDAGAAQGAHANLYKKVLGNLKAGKSKGRNFYVCPLCGNVLENLKSPKCPICRTGRKEFITVN